MTSVQLACPECGKTMSLRTGRFGQFYACQEYPACQGAHGAHPDGRPLGIPATKATRDARIKAHVAFDRLWKHPSGVMKRGEAYAWLAKRMGRTVVHIGGMNEQECYDVIAHVRAHIANGAA